MTGSEGVYGHEAQGRRTIQEYIIIQMVVERAKDLTKPEFLFIHRGHFHLGSYQIWSCGDKGEAGELCLGDGLLS